MAEGFPTREDILHRVPQTSLMGEDRTQHPVFLTPRTLEVPTLRDLSRVATQHRHQEELRNSIIHRGIAREGQSDLELTNATSTASMATSRENATCVPSWIA